MITAFTISGLLIIGLIGIYFYRNRKASEPVESLNTDSNADQSQPSNKAASNIKSDRETLPAMTTITIKQQALHGKTSVRSKKDKSLLKMIQEKSEKPKSCGLLIGGLNGGDKILIQNDFGDDQSDYSNVPLANLYKK